MKLKYMLNGQTLFLDSDRCTGCRECIEVCPHAVFAMSEGKARIVDRESCMECGACMKNCEAGAIRVKAGVGCASAVISGLIRGTEPTCGCDSSCGSGAKSAAAKPGCC
jgi:NAD-dependent dihydropyrimidine dehydrogenase PreA subunit